MTDTILADVSHHQDAPRSELIDWAAYAGRHKAAICKATGGTERSGGTTWVDPEFKHNQAQMRARLEVRGYYHFLQTDGDPVAQARHFAKTVGRLLPGEFAVLDVEQDTQTAKHEAFCREVDRLLGGTCWLYGGRDVPNPHRRPYWVARYWNETPDPRGEPSVRHVLWQYTSKGRAPGVAGNIDLNVHRGTLASLARYAMPKPRRRSPVQVVRTVRKPKVDLPHVVLGYHHGIPPAGTQDLRDFQSALGQTPDGVPGPKTRAAYERAVKAVQKAIGAQQTGVWDRQTNHALIAMQTKLRVTVDAVYGPETEEALERWLAR